MQQTSVHPTKTLSERLGRLRGHRAVCRINEFFRSPGYVLLVGLLAAVANLFSTELAVYSFYILCGVYLSLFGEDYLPLMPIVICCYIAPSVGNNPGYSGDSIFFPQNGGWFLILLAVTFAASAVFRLVTDRELGGKAFLKRERKLLSGMLLLGGAYVLSGVGSGHYFANGWNNLLFSLAQFIAVALMYWFFVGAVHWERAPKDYFGWISLCVGLALVLELVNIYCSTEVVINGEIDRLKIFTGWGMHNNIGAMLAMTVPGTVYLSLERKNGWLFGVIAMFFLGNVLFTCSRGSIAFGMLIGMISGALVLKIATQKRVGIAVIGIGMAVVLVTFLIFRERLTELFRMILQKGLDPMGRDQIFREGIKQFLRYPVFGGTFYPIDFEPWEWSTVEGFSAFFPPRWHNTLIQLAASCGVVGLAAYGVHRVQTLKLVFRSPSAEKYFIGLTVLVLLGTSLLDCHMFNIGPVLWYSMLLAIAEKSDVATK